MCDCMCMHVNAWSSKRLNVLSTEVKDVERKRNVLFGKPLPKYKFIYNIYIYMCM